MCPGDGQGTAGGRLLAYAERVFVCLTGDRGRCRNAGEERPLLGQVRWIPRLAGSWRASAWSGYGVDNIPTTAVNRRKACVGVLAEEEYIREIVTCGLR